MENNFKGRIIYSENYQSTIDSIKLINSSGSNKATLTKQNRDYTDLSTTSDIRIIKGYENITKIKQSNLKAPKLLSAYDESILELNSLEGKVRCIAHCYIIQTEKNIFLQDLFP